MDYRLLCNDDPVAVVMEGKTGHVLLQIDGNRQGIYSCVWHENCGDPSNLSREIVMRARRRSRRVCSLDRDDMERTLGTKAADALCLTDLAISKLYPRSFTDIEATTSSVSS